MPDAASPPRFPTRRALLRGVGAGLVCAVGLEVANVLVGPNCHTVIPGAVYRSSQPAGGRLERLIKQYGIRTVVNFRGVCEESAWYREQCRVTNRYGVSEEDINGSSAGRLPSVYTVREFVAILDRSAYPILLHCNRGIDRTGMASAIALLLKTDASVAVARRELGYRHGHLPFGRTGNIDFFFDLYEEWLAAGHGPHSPEVFRRWLTKDYCPGPCRAEVTAADKALLPARTLSRFRVSCKNTSVRPWHLRPGNNAGIHVMYFVDDAEGKCVAQGRSGLLDAVVAPGESIELALAIQPLPAGNYTLRADMTDEQHGAFLQVGSEPLFLALEVR